MAADKSIFRSSLTEVTTAAKDTLGDIRRENGKVYKYILYSSGTGGVAGTAGDLVVYHGDNGADDNQVSKDYTDGVVPAGFLMAAMADATYGWMQTHGYITITTAIETSNDGTPVACADGDAICIGDADGAVRRMQTVTDADSELEYPIGIAIDASAKKCLIAIPY